MSVQLDQFAVSDNVRDAAHIGREFAHHAD
jgi:hypothetical protein